MDMSQTTSGKFNQKTQAAHSSSRIQKDIELSNYVNVTSSASSFKSKGENRESESSGGYIDMTSSVFYKLKKIKSKAKSSSVTSSKSPSTTNKGKSSSGVDVDVLSPGSLKSANIASKNISSTDVC